MRPNFSLVESQCGRTRALSQLLENMLWRLNTSLSEATNISKRMLSALDQNSKPTRSCERPVHNFDSSLPDTTFHWDMKHSTGDFEPWRKGPLQLWAPCSDSESFPPPTSPLATKGLSKHATSGDMSPHGPVQKRSNTAQPHTGTKKPVNKPQGRGNWKEM